jgi:hypothetical protein
LKCFCLFVIAAFILIKAVLDATVVSFIIAVAVVLVDLVAIVVYFSLVKVILDQI